MFQIALNESTATRRRFLLPQCVSDADGVMPMTGMTFAASELRISKAGAAEGNAGGSVGELGGGFYYYEPAAGEVDTRGFLSARLNKSGVRGDAVMVQVGLELSAAENFWNLTDGIEAGLKPKEALQAIFATTASVRSGVGTATEVFKSRNGLTNRVTGTIDGSNNRTAVSYSFS